MPQTRSGGGYETDYSGFDNIPLDNSPDDLWTNQQIISAVTPSFRAMAADPKFKTDTGNIAALLAKFERRKVFMLKGYSTNSSLDWDKRNAHDIVDQTHDFVGQFSQQTNSQARNHTEPKLLQEFEDYFLIQKSGVNLGLKWVVVVTDRPCCGTCLGGSINPFAEWARNNNVGFYVVDLSHTIKNADWSVTRTSYS